MNKNYVKLNINDNHLSLGNFFNRIKKYSKNKSSAIQTEIFCTLMDIDNISETTVNNYCTGLRAINNTYKQLYLNNRKQWHSNKSILIHTINNIASIIDGYVYNYNTIKELNNLNCLKTLTDSMHILVKNDSYVSYNQKKEILNLITKKNYYEALCQIIFFIILDKVQPLYIEDEINNTIESLVKNTNLSINDLQKFLSIKFKEGNSFIFSLKKLAKENNPYALNELGNLEYDGKITGYHRYEEAFEYHKKAAMFDHPTSTWMIAHMIINKNIGSLSDNDIEVAWKYLKKAESLGSISSLNTIGLCYLNGYTKDKTINLDKAITYFKKAADNDYIFAYNNLGLIMEKKHDYQAAFNYYLKSANEEESWACNKIATYYLFGTNGTKDLAKALSYFTTGANAMISTLCPWNIINLVKYFYLNGNAEVGIKKDIDKSISLLKQVEDFPYSHELLLYAYYEKYIEDYTYLDKVKYYLNKINNSIIYNKKQKQLIESNLKNIYKINLDM